MSFTYSEAGGSIVRQVLPDLATARRGDGVARRLDFQAQAPRFLEQFGV